MDIDVDTGSSFAESVIDSVGVAGAVGAKVVVHLRDLSADDSLVAPRHGMLLQERLNREIAELHEFPRFDQIVAALARQPPADAMRDVFKDNEIFSGIEPRRLSLF